MNSFCRSVLLGFGFLLIGLAVRAQVVSDGATNTLSDATNSLGAVNVVVGTNGSFTGYLLTNNALLTNTGIGVIGLNAGANSNYVFLQGTNTRWNLTGGLTIGSNGAFNQLIVSNGSTVASAGSSVLGGTMPSSNNLAVVTGAGSLWTNSSELRVGNSGSGNQLLLSDGGTVANSIGYVGFASTSSNNLAVVTGTGSVWSNRTRFYVGYSGAGNTLRIEDGGIVKDEDGYLGYNSSASNNLVAVSGAGSVWINNFSLHVGYYGAGNTLLITNGGSLQGSGGINYRADIGYDSSASNNLAVVTGAGSVWNGSGLLNVGYSGAGNTLLITNGGLLHNASTATLGANPTASNNVAVVTGAGSVWNSGSLIVGSLGVGNMVLITNGGVMNNGGYGYIGINSSAHNNSVVVTGNGSMLSNASGLYVGHSGAGNTLRVEDGGLVQSAFGQLGRHSSSSNNVAVVTGTNSVWSNSGSFIVGNFSLGNLLLITNGGLVNNSGVGFLGGGDSAASNNLAVVTGAGSVWNNSGLYVGHVSAGNLLLITNGGTVVVSNAAYLGSSSTSPSSSFTNNRVMTDGGSLHVKNATGTGVFEIRRGTNQFNSGLMDLDQLVMANTPGIFEFNGGTLITRGGIISNGTAFILGNAGTTPALWDVRTGIAGSNVVVASDLVIGHNVANSRLLITNGQSLQVLDNSGSGASSIFGANAASTNNLALISGGGSYWSNANNLIIGSNSAWNQLIITNGGLVRNSLGILGANSTSSNNVAVVTGANSVWSNIGNLIVGDYGAENSLILTNGGSLGNDFAYLGYNASSSNNTVVVTDAGSVWANSGSLSLGYMGSANLLVVSNGGLVTSGGGYVGDNFGPMFGSDPGGNDNVALITGAGSRWENAGGLLVGVSSVRNQLLITESGVVTSGSGALGWLAGANHNRALVSGAGSLWTNASELRVGNFGSGNQLVISYAGAVISAGGFIGHDSVSSSNVAVVTGAGSRWTNLGDFHVGYRGSGNQLFVSDGAVVVADHSAVGWDGSAINNLAVVSGAGALWTNSGELRIGYSGSGNQLVISNGAQVISASGDVGLNPLANSNQVFITGAGSGWTTAGDLLVGNFGDENQLLVSDGGRMANAPGFVGRLGVSNRVEVTGAGSLWTNSGELFVGQYGAGNQLVVSNGGVVVSSNGWLGQEMGADRNAALVTGLESQWINAGQLYVGGSGAGNQLVVSNGGTVSANGVFVGLNDSSTNNRITVADGTLISTNTSRTAVLDIRRGTNVLNAGLLVTDRLLLTNGSLSRFDFNGGTLNVRTSVVNNGTPFIVGNGTSSAALNLLGNGTHTFANNLIVSSNAQLTGNGTLLTTSVASFGTIAPGNSAGALNIATNLLLFDSAKLTFEIGGLIATNDYDRINVGSLLQMGGTLSLELINNFLPEPEHTFTLLTFGTQSGSFTNIMGGRVSLTNNLASFAVTQTATNLQLSGVTYVDTDGDGQGDLQELAAGTDPNASGSYLQITSLAQNGSGHYVIQFQSVPGKSYRIEWTDNFVTWNSVLSPVLTTPAPGISQWTDNGTLTGGLPSSRTYRVGLQ